MKIAYVLPLLVLFLLGWALYKSLEKPPERPLSQENLPIAMKSFPAFRLEALTQPQDVYTETLLKNRVSLIHIWASWCEACRKDHDFIMSLERVGSLSAETPLQWIGIAFKDIPEEVLLFLENQGNPYPLVLGDEEGRLAVDLGVKGLPETLLVDSHGMIRLRHIGPLEEEVWNSKFLPLLEELKVL